MYKLSEVATKLNIEKVLLIELLFTKGEYLEGNIIKKHGLTYLSEDAIIIIDKIIRGEEVFIANSNYSESNTNDDLIKEDDLENIDDKEILSEDISKSQNSIIHIESLNIDEIEIDKSEDIKKLEILTEKSKYLKFEKDEKRNKISKLRNDFLALDSEIRKKQEALESYDRILEEDIQWVCLLEDKLSVKLKEKFSKESEDEISQKKLMDKMFFKR